MEEEREARKAVLKVQMEHAVVKHIGTEANDYPSYDVGTYSVFVPGAFRERNIVKAESEEEAKAKVLACLEKKLDVTSLNEPDVELSPDNMKIKLKGKVDVAQGEEA